MTASPESSKEIATVKDADMTPIRSGEDRRSGMDRRQSAKTSQTQTSTKAPRIKDASVQAVLEEQKTKTHPFYGRPPIDPKEAAIWKQAKEIYQSTKLTDAVERILSEQLAKPRPFIGHPPTKPAKLAAWKKAKAKYTEQKQSQSEAA